MNQFIEIASLAAVVPVERAVPPVPPPIWYFVELCVFSKVYVVGVPAFLVTLHVICLLGFVIVFDETRPVRLE